MEIMYKYIGLSVFWAILAVALVILLLKFWEWNVRKRTLTFQLHELARMVWKHEIKKIKMNNEYYELILQILEREAGHSRKFLFGKYYRNLIKRKTQC